MFFDSPADRCFVVLPSQPRGRNVAVCERGRIGVRVTSVDLGETDKARQAVRELNAALGVSPAAQREMVSCALHGWARASLSIAVQAAPSVLLH